MKMYTHMPFFLNENEGFFSVSNELITHKISEDSNSYQFRPWRGVYGNLNNYKYLDFPFLPTNHFEVHCSPIFYDNIYSVSFNRSIYTKTDNSSWSQIFTRIWQGYQDCNGLNYVTQNKCFINSKEIKLPFNGTVYRVCPYGKYFIITGIVNNQRKSFFYDGKQFAEILANGKSVYKCSIADDILFHSVAEDEKGIETYKIHQTKSFNFDYNSEALQS